MKRLASSAQEGARNGHLSASEAHGALVSGQALDMATVMTTVDRLERLSCERLPGGLELRRARSAAQRGRGLAGLSGLPPHVGLELHRCRAVHTVGMRFALDLLWLDGDGHVLRIDRGVAPRRHRACLRARSVVEVTAGGAERWAQAMAAR